MSQAAVSKMTLNELILDIIIEIMHINKLTIIIKIKLNTTVYNDLLYPLATVSYLQFFCLLINVLVHGVLQFFREFNSIGLLPL